MRLLTYIGRVIAYAFVCCLLGCTPNVTGSRAWALCQQAAGNPKLELVKKVKCSEDIDLFLATDGNPDEPIVFATRKGVPICWINTFGNGQEIYVGNGGAELVVTTNSPPAPSSCDVGRYVRGRLEGTEQRLLITYDSEGNVDTRTPVK